MKLFNHQKLFLQKNPNKSVLVWSCGTSKTRTALEWSKLNGGSTLAIVPKALATNWKREMIKWNIPDVIVMTKETFRREAQGLPRFDQVIVDEIHNGFLTPHFKSQMSKALRNYLKFHKVERFLGLSATVYTSSPWNIFNLAHYVGYKLDWKQFDWDYFDHIRMGPRIIPVAKKGSEKRLAELTKKFADVVAIEDCIDVPEQTFETEYFNLTDEQKKEIKNAYDPLPIVRFSKIHEIESGILKGNEFTKDRMNIHALKNERMFSLCEENKKIIIVCRYNLQIDFLKEYLFSIKKPIFIIRGDVKDRDSVVQESEKSEEAIVLIQAMCSMGYELPSFRIMVFASMDFSYTHYKQICGRILRINNLQKNLYLHLIAGEMDQAVLDAIGRKHDFNIELYAKR